MSAIEILKLFISDVAIIIYLVIISVVLIFFIYKQSKKRKVFKQVEEDNLRIKQQNELNKALINDVISRGE
ncbi:MAG: hypothetical protein U0L17_03175 [Acutalibacteraceae bacterium]|nr:hypothetical protein [Acutalibacteraceae bacterium]